ncbi:hypothetical protein FHX34_102927 [Actinoplanes teichomyceticus]|uniref:Uncharacterized protein n=1 Tax=Actinoplanes teichomyceticus TaxID=1867 RepID=A0A561WKH8_ACTTI|nr:hypothetical protein FHX34_102927 [Actinoplanes teichomyceticus]
MTWIPAVWRSATARPSQLDGRLFGSLAGGSVSVGIMLAATTPVGAPLGCLRPEVAWGRPGLPILGG